MTTEEAIKWMQETRLGGEVMGDKAVVAACDMAIDAIRAIHRLGKFGRIFMDYEGCPRGAAGRSGLPLEEEVLSMPKIKDVDGGEWVPVNADALTEIVNRYKTLCAQQQERENPKPLTLDELREMDGEPVWVCSVKEKGKIPDRWMLLTGFRAEGNIFLFVPAAGLMQGYKESSYGKTWLAYRHKPGEE